MHPLEPFGRVCCDPWRIDSDRLGISRSSILGLSRSSLFTDSRSNWNYNSVLLDFKLFHSRLTNLRTARYIGLAFVRWLFSCVWVELGLCCCCWTGCNCCLSSICPRTVWRFSAGTKRGLFFPRGSALTVDIYQEKKNMLNSLFYVFS